MSPPTDGDDPRRVRSRAKVLAAAVEILKDDGLAGFSVEAVAAQSGVAKTTIYRQFANRDELHVAAVQSVACTVPIPDTDDLVADMASFCVGLNSLMRTGDFGAVLPTGFDGAERSASLAEMVHATGAERREATLRRLRVAQDRGELAADIDIDLVNSQLVGPLFFRRFVSRQATTSEWVEHHVRSLLTPMVRATSGAPVGAGSPRSGR